jgi:hypothetical protein
MNFSLDLSSPQAVAAIVAGVVSAVVTCYVMIVKFRLDNRTVFQAELAARGANDECQMAMADI